MPFHAREKIGRNDPCPCGSGRKYKHCCIPSHTPSIDTLWARQHEDYARLTREMTRFAERKFEKQIYDAWQDFNLSDIPELLEQSSDELQVFMPYFCFSGTRIGRLEAKRHIGEAAWSLAGTCWRSRSS